MIADRRAERIVAGWLLNCEDLESGVDWSRAADLTPEHFNADPTARIVFTCANTLHAEGKRVGVESVRAKSGLNLFDLEALSNEAPTSAYFGDSLRSLRECRHRRQLAELGKRLTESATNGEGTATIQADLIRALERPGGTIAGAWPAPVSAACLCATPPPTPPILIDGALYQGGTMLLAGPSKAAKTWTMLDLGLAVSTGTDWLGFKTAKAPVLYLNLEVPEFVAEQRVRALCVRRGIEPPDAFHLWNLRGFVVTVDDLEREIPRRIAKDGVGLVIIDPHYKVSATSGAEENSNDSQGALLAKLEAMTSACGSALAIAHHFAKGDAGSKNAIDRASGGGVFARWPDVFLALTPHEEEGAMTLDFVLRAFAPVPPRVVRWEFPAWIADNTLDPTRLKKTGRADAHPRTKALEDLRDGMTSAEWQKALGWNDRTFRRKRDELVSSGAVRLSSGCYYHTAEERKAA